VVLSRAQAVGGCNPLCRRGNSSSEYAMTKTELKEQNEVLRNLLVEIRDMIESELEAMDELDDEDDEEDDIEED